MREFALICRAAQPLTMSAGKTEAGSAEEESDVTGSEGEEASWCAAAPPLFFFRARLTA